MNTIKRVKDTLQNLNETTIYVSLKEKTIVEIAVNVNVLKSTVENVGYNVIGIKNV